MRLRLKRLALLLGTLVLALGVAEVASRWLGAERYYVWPPGFQKTFRVHDKVAGIQGESQLTINSFGVRGDELSPANRYRLLAVGGSTTICSYLDDSEAWPQLAQDLVNAVLGPETVWIGNAGRPGHTTVQHVLQVEKLLPQHPELDGVVLLVGINDMLAVVGRILEARTAYDSRRAPLTADLDSHLRLAFNLVPPAEGAPWYRKTFLGRVYSALFEAPRLPEGLPEQDAVGTLVMRARELRRQAGSYHELPQLGGALAAYADNLHRIVDLAEASGARVIFLTQPVLWRPDLSEEERALLWMGGPPLDRSRPGAPYYTVESLARGIARYNRTLLGVCREREVECVDVAETLSGDPAVFWDDAHFTEEGSRRVARALAAYLLGTEPLLDLAASRPGAPR